MQEDEEFAAKVIAKLEEGAEDEDALIEERRRRRQELLARLQQEQALTSELSPGHICNWGMEAAQECRLCE